MKAHLFKTATLALALVVGIAVPASARPAPDSFADLAERVTPAVVNVSVVQSAGPQLMGSPEIPLPEGFPREFFERFFGDRQPMPAPRGERKVSGVGSGFIIDPQGYVVTNNHVVDGAEELTITLADGESFPGEVIGRDPKTDLALVKVEADRPLPSVSFGDSDAIRPGDWVMAVGNPFGLGGSVTVGIVSARGRNINAGPYDDFIQTDAAINRGNSGGPMFDIDGNVIGVNTAIFSPNGGSIGIGFAIPANLAKGVIDDLRDKGYVERSWLGVRIQRLTDEIAEGFGLDAPRGALVAAVEPNSPAAEAGLRPGDVILEWDGVTVEEMRDLPRLVAETPVGERVDIRIWRDRDEVELGVTTARLEEERHAALGGQERVLPGGAVTLADSGLTVADLTAERRERLGLDASVEGVVVTRVEPGSPAARQGLRPGDVIRSIAMEEVASAEEALEVVERLRRSGTRVATVLALRDGQASFFALPLNLA